MPDDAGTGQRLDGQWGSSWRETEGDPAWQKAASAYSGRFESLPDFFIVDELARKLQGGDLAENQKPNLLQVLYTLGRQR